MLFLKARDEALQIYCAWLPRTVNPLEYDRHSEALPRSCPVAHLVQGLRGSRRA
jgi:hypothetical protein